MTDPLFDEQPSQAVNLLRRRARSAISDKPRLLREAAGAWRKSVLMDAVVAGGALWMGVGLPFVAGVLGVSVWNTGGLLLQRRAIARDAAKGQAFLDRDLAAQTQAVADQMSETTTRRRIKQVLRSRRFSVVKRVAQTAVLFACAGGMGLAAVAHFSLVDAAVAGGAALLGSFGAHQMMQARRDYKTDRAKVRAGDLDAFRDTDLISADAADQRQAAYDQQRLAIARARSAAPAEREPAAAATERLDVAPAAAAGRPRGP